MEIKKKQFKNLNRINNSEKIPEKFIKKILVINYEILILIKT